MARSTANEIMPKWSTSNMVGKNQGIMGMHAALKLAARAIDPEGGDQAYSFQCNKVGFLCIHCANHILTFLRK